ncbi:MAG: GNAT family N-acetyltransferase [Candidatus Puniceispirillaceae bacterium]
MTEEEMMLGIPILDYKIPPHPKGLHLEGAYCRLEPLDPKRHASMLFSHLSGADTAQNWAYLPYGPFADEGAFAAWLSEMAGLDDPVFFTLLDKETGTPLGLASYLRIKPEAGSIEVGHIHFSNKLQRSLMASEAMYLMMGWAMEAGYRRYEWKCNALNLRSRRAAQRLGFSYEGVFRQAAIFKERNRDTAWFALIDSEWPALKACFERYFETHGEARLSEMTRPLLFKIDPQLS